MSCGIGQEFGEMIMIGSSELVFDYDGVFFIPNEVCDNVTGKVRTSSFTPWVLDLQLKVLSEKLQPIFSR